MNIIDKNFYQLVDNIKKQTLEEIYQIIKNNYQKLNPNIQISLENFLNKFLYWGTLKKDEENYEELYNRAQSLKEHIDDYIWLYNKLNDYRSRKLLFAILNNWYNFDFETLKTSNETNYPHYFDLDIIKCNQEEIIVDLGSYTGDTITDYLKYYGTNNYEKIYCYEITDHIFNILKNNLSYYKNIEFRKKAVLDKTQKVYISKNKLDNSANKISTGGDTPIDAVSLDEDIKEKISLIKMDIEGSETKALTGCKNHIINEQPKLLISVYHNHEDLWKIPKMIDNLYDNYNFYLRYYGNNIFPTEIVLIATNKKD